MSQIFFSKQDPTEKLSRLSLLGSSRGSLTLWLKGSKDKVSFSVSNYDKDREEVVLETKEKFFELGQKVLCSFELRGMSFFSEVLFQESISGFIVLQFKDTLFKSERRESFRLLTYPLYDVWAEFKIDEKYLGEKVFNIKNGTTQTGIFKSFLQLVDGESEDSKESSSTLKIRIQDLSTTGIALHVSEIEQKFFQKGTLFQNLLIRFTDEKIEIPEAKVVYLVDFVSSDKRSKKFKVGIHFENLSSSLDVMIGKKINLLLRSNDFNKDFENFIK